MKTHSFVWISSSSNLLQLNSCERWQRLYPTVLINGTVTLLLIHRRKKSRSSSWKLKSYFKTFRLRMRSGLLRLFYYWSSAELSLLCCDGLIEVGSPMGSSDEARVCIVFGYRLKILNSINFIVLDRSEKVKIWIFFNWFSLSFFAKEVERGNMRNCR